LTIALLMLAGALALDTAFGEPPNRVHPVAWLGKVIAWAERRAPRGGARRELVAGAVIALSLPIGFAALTALLMERLRSFPALELIAGALLLKSMFALRALGQAAMVVRDALARGDIRGARCGLSSLCSRDPAALDEPALVAATVESVAENASDSIVAPLFYYALLGLPGAVFYRAVNTLDAMIGYHGRYEYLGKTAARLDDLLNFVPARLTAGLILVAGFLHREDARRGFLILVRDSGRTESPNAGRPMAAMAGLLGVELSKQGHYCLGDPLEALTLTKIDAAVRVVTLAAFLSAAAVAFTLGVWPAHAP
jgi:adenosylcobinamide-phosphate synthase